MTKYRKELLEGFVRAFIGATVRICKNDEEIDFVITAIADTGEEGISKEGGKDE